MCSEARQFFHAMQQGRPAIAFAATEAGLDVMLLGNSQPDRLMRLARLSLGDPGFLSVRQVFARLGDGLLNAQRARGAATEIADARAAVRNTEARCQDLHAALEAERIRTRAAIEAESEAVQQHALLQSQLFDLKGRVADAEDPAVRDKEAVQLHETVERLQGELSGSRKARDAAIARAKALEAEKATLRAEVEAAVEKRKDHWKRIEKLTAELSAVQERLGATGKAHEKALAAEADRRKVAERHLAETQAALEVRAQEAKSLTEDLAKSRSDEARKEKTLGEASAARKAAEKRAETLAHDLAGAANRNEELARQLAEAVAARERALSTINALEERLAAAKEKHVALWEAHELLKAAHAGVLARNGDEQQSGEAQAAERDPPGEDRAREHAGARNGELIPDERPHDGRTTAGFDLD